MGSKNVLAGLFRLPIVTIALGSEATLRVDLLDLVHVFWSTHGAAVGWALDEEGIVGVSSWMTLRLEKGVEVPEGRLNISVGWHLFEAHLEEDLPELFPNLH